MISKVPSLIRRPQNRLPLIHVLGAVSLAGYIVLVVLAGNGSPARVLAGLAVLAALFLPYAWLCRSARDLEAASERRTLVRRETVALLFWALLFRLALLPAGVDIDQPVQSFSADLSSEEAGFQPFLLWDNDVWRYLWDGHLVAHGISPYQLPPSTVVDAADNSLPWAEELVDEGPWWDVLDRISYGEYRTVYPPVALALFRLAHWVVPGSVLVWKVLLTSIEFTGCLLFVVLLARLRLPHRLAVVLAWNPLLIKEVAGSGHLDGALVCLFALALLALERRRMALAIACLAVATLLKLWPILFVPVLLVRARWTAWWPLPTVLLIGYWPFSSELIELGQALRAFSSEWVFNPGPWLGIEQLGHWAGASGRTLPDVVFLLMLAAASAVAVWLARRAKHLGARDQVQSVAGEWLLVGTVFVLFSATVMPWYLVALLPMAALTRCWPLPVATAASLLSYLIYVTGQESGWVLAIEFSIVVFAYAVWWRQRVGSLAQPRVS